MKTRMRCIGFLGLAAVLFTACPNNPQSGTVTFTALAEHLATRSIQPRAQSSVNMTPSAYKIALVNFWLIKDDGTEVSLLNPDIDAPIYTEANPLIVDFTTADSAQTILSGAVLEGGTYTGYKMQFLYLEMRLNADFHIPTAATDETDLDAADIAEASVIGTTADYDFRLYFNAIGQYWKRDFIVELVDGSDAWFWLRRSIEGEYDNFFIQTASTAHPAGNGAPDSTIDLFSDDAFWGLPENYDDSGSPVIISTLSKVGGVNAVLATPFTIDAANYTMVLHVDVQGTMNFWEDDANPLAGSEGFTTGVLDLGPGYGTDLYGDIGLHPFVPSFTIEVQAGA